MNLRNVKSAAAEASGLPTFATLNNRRLVVTGASDKAVVVERHFLVRLLTPSVARILIDEEFYCAKYPDVAQIIEHGELRSAREHYVKFGYYENRLPYPITVDEPWYLSSYPDVAAAVHREEFSSGQEHFESIGYREGRLPFAKFRLRTA